MATKKKTPKNKKPHQYVSVELALLQVIHWLLFLFEKNMQISLEDQRAHVDAIKHSGMKWSPSCQTCQHLFFFLKWESPHSPSWVEIAQSSHAPIRNSLPTSLFENRSVINHDRDISYSC